MKQSAYVNHRLALPIVAIGSGQAVVGMRISHSGALAEVSAGRAIGAALLKEG